jgi:UDP-glucose 4-epimerase
LSLPSDRSRSRGPGEPGKGLDDVAAEGGRRVLVTGVAGPLARRLAARLEDDDRVEYIAGVDLSEPPEGLRRTEFVRGDLRNPLVAKIVDSTRVDTIVHLAITTTPRRAGGRGRMKELNVIGTMQLLAAAQKATRLRRMVVRSTTAVYGSHYADPALWREDSEIGNHGSPHGYAKDAIEVERYARGFARRRPDATLTVLRFANFLGPTVASPLTGYFGLPVVPTVLGYDPRLQFCHEDDAVEILYRSAMEEHPGVYNVAGPGILYLSQAIRLAGRPTVVVPQPLMTSTAGMVRRTGRVDFSPEQLSFLLFGRVGDITRMRQEFEHEPAYSTRAAFDDFVAARGIRPVVAEDTLRSWEQGAADLLGRLARSTGLAGARGGGA